MNLMNSFFFCSQNLEGTSQSDEDDLETSRITAHHRSFVEITKNRRKEAASVHCLSEE